MSELREHLFVPYSELQEGDELTDAFTIAKSYCLKSEADKAIAEKDKEIARLDDLAHAHNIELLRKENLIAELEESHKKEVEQLLMEIAELEEERRWRNVDDKFPTADEGYILVLWEDGLPDIGYIGAEDDVIETVRDRGEGHSVDWWMPLPSAPKEGK